MEINKDEASIALEWYRKVQYRWYTTRRQDKLAERLEEFVKNNA